jgi:hypothetical protein
MSALFLVSASAVERLLPDERLHAVQFFPGRTVCAIAAVEYRDNDLGQYNEIGIAFFVHHGEHAPGVFFGAINAFRNGTVGAYIHRLPVTTTFSRDAGRDIWGFPKTVDSVEFLDENSRRSATWTIDGTHVLTLSMPRGGKRVMKESPQIAYAYRDGMLWKTASIMGGEGVGVALRNVQLVLGPHPIADELRALGLPKRPMLSTWMEHMHASFDAPQCFEGKARVPR